MQHFKLSEDGIKSWKMWHATHFFVCVIFSLFLHKPCLWSLKTKPWAKLWQYSYIFKMYALLQPLGNGSLFFWFCKNKKSCDYCDCDELLFLSCFFNNFVFLQHSAIIGTPSNGNHGLNSLFAGGWFVGIFYSPILTFYTGDGRVNKCVMSSFVVAIVDACVHC